MATLRGTEARTQRRPERTVSERRDEEWSGAVRETTRRPLRVYRSDPMADRYLEPFILAVSYELLEPGPKGRLIEVVDLDGSVAVPLDLDASDVLIGSGVAPSEQDPAFHAQMLYAVTMRMLEMCERALGRVLVWSDGRTLRLVPRAFDGANCFIELDRLTVQFGSFVANEPNDAILPGQLVHTCLSADAVAHEASHAVIETVHGWAQMGSASSTDEDDGYAIVESVADLIALLVRLSEPEVIATSLRSGRVTPNDLSSLFALAPQFGVALRGSALRSFPREPDRKLFASETEPHARSEILSSIVVAGYLAGYKRAASGLLALAGQAQSSEWVHPDLVHRLSRSAAALSMEMLMTVVGCLDLLPPTRLRFVDAVRALITVDRERFGTAHAAVRAAMLNEALRWGALDGLTSLDEESVAYESVAPSDSEQLTPVPFAAEALYLTIRATELRRRWMTETRRQFIPDLVTERQKLAADKDELERKARASIPKWARAVAPAIGESHRSYHLISIEGSLRPDAPGSVRGRVAVQIGGGTRARPSGDGFTVWCDSGGRVIYKSAATPKPVPRGQG